MHAVKLSSTIDNQSIEKELKMPRVFGKEGKTACNTEKGKLGEEEALNYTLCKH